jgi:hypothetical protein
MWHGVAALLPLPVIGFACLAAVPGNPVALQLELYLSGQGSTHALSRTGSAPASHLSRQAEALFRASGKGPRADAYRGEGFVTSEGKQQIVASLGGEPDLTSALGKKSQIIRDRKTDRLKPRSSDVALKSGSVANPLLMNASYGSMFGPGLDVDAFKPSPEEIAYSPTSNALDFRSKGETQAEFEERERRCLSVAIYFEARGEPVRGQIAVAQVILNRTFSGHYPNTVFGVVYQNSHRHNACQFSFTCDGIPDVVREPDAMERTKKIAALMLDGKLWLPEVGHSTHFHAYWVHPSWVNEMKRLHKIGVHSFYRPRAWGDGSEVPPLAPPQVRLQVDDAATKAKL